jgi:hypothetical protein
MELVMPTPAAPRPRTQGELMLCMEQEKADIFSDKPTEVIDENAAPTK